jgi:hypothetical protein
MLEWTTGAIGLLGGDWLAGDDGRAEGSMRQRFPAAAAKRFMPSLADDDL